MTRKTRSSKPKARFCLRCGYQLAAGEAACPMCARLEQTRRNFVIPRPGELTHLRGDDSADLGDGATPHRHAEELRQGQGHSSTLWEHRTTPAGSGVPEVQRQRNVLATASLREDVPRNRKQATRLPGDSPEEEAHAGPLPTELSKGGPQWRFSRRGPTWREHTTTLVTVTVGLTAGLAKAVVGLLLR